MNESSPSTYRVVPSGERVGVAVTHQGREGGREGGRGGGREGGRDLPSFTSWTVERVHYFVGCFLSRLYVLACFRREITNLNDVTTEKIVTHVLCFADTLISSHSFFHYLPFQRPFTPTALCGWGLYS